MVMKILFIGDIFGEKSLNAVAAFLPNYIRENNFKFVIVQGENISGRKGLVKKDYELLKEMGVDAITMGNHVWAKDEINEYIDDSDVIRPYNVNDVYPGVGSKVFTINNETIRVTSFLGKSFNKLRNPWKQEYANNFFDAFDALEKETKTDYHFIDFHAETTSEKNVFGLYLDGKINILVGTHTHVQTNDAKVLPQGSLYITDVGMTGPIDCAIGASYESVYEKMRHPKRRVRFEVSNTPIEFNAVSVYLEKNMKNQTIKTLKFLI